jgi:hypothetical protein
MPIVSHRVAMRSRPMANPIRVLERSSRDKGLGKGVKKGRIWTYVRE